jgi:hypothetical protein
MRLEVFPAQIVAPQGHPAFNDAGEREDDDTDIFVRKVFADRALKDFDVFFGVCRRTNNVGKAGGDDMTRTAELLNELIEPCLSLSVGAVVCWFLMHL